MIWHEYGKEIPEDMQRVLIKREDSIGVGIFHNGKYGFGLTQVMVLEGPMTDLNIFTHWVSLKEIKELK